MENKVVDALSRKSMSSIEQQLYHLQSVVVPSWKQHLEHSYEGDLKATKLIQQLSTAPTALNNYQLKNGVLFYKNRMYVGASTTLRQLLETYHNSLVGGHSGVHATYLLLI